MAEGETGTEIVLPAAAFTGAMSARAAALGRVWSVSVEGFHEEFVLKTSTPPAVAMVDSTLSVSRADVTVLPFKDAVGNFRYVLSAEFVALRYP
jgi:hypothetical protein